MHFKEGVKWVLILFVISILPACGGKGQAPEEEGTEIEFTPDYDYDGGPVGFGDDLVDGTACDLALVINQKVEISGGFLNNNQIPYNLTITIDATTKAGAAGQKIAIANDYNSGMTFSPTTKTISFLFDAENYNSYKVTVSASGIATLVSPVITVSRPTNCHPDAHTVQFNY